MTPINVLGPPLKNGRAGEKHLAWNLPNLGGSETLTVTSDDFGNGETMPLRTASMRCGGQDQSPRFAWNHAPEGTAQLLRVLRSGMGRGHLGPAPVKAHGTHRYVFELFALPSPVPGTAERLRPRAALGAPVLARGRPSGVFER